MSPSGRSGGVRLRLHRGGRIRYSGHGPNTPAPAPGEARRNPQTVKGRKGCPLPGNVVWEKARISTEITFTPWVALRGTCIHPASPPGRQTGTLRLGRPPRGPCARRTQPAGVTPDCVVPASAHGLRGGLTPQPPATSMRKHPGGTWVLGVGSCSETPSSQEAQNLGRGIPPCRRLPGDGPVLPR